MGLLKSSCNSGGSRTSRFWKSRALRPNLQTMERAKEPGVEGVSEALPTEPTLHWAPRTEVTRTGTLRLGVGSKPF